MEVQMHRSMVPTHVPGGAHTHLLHLCTMAGCQILPDSCQIHAVLRMGTRGPRWSHSHTLTGASGPQLLREWTEKLADARGMQGQRRAVSPLGDSAGGAQTARSMDLNSIGGCCTVTSPDSYHALLSDTISGALVTLRSVVSSV